MSYNAKEAEDNKDEIAKRERAAKANSQNQAEHDNPYLRHLSTIATEDVAGLMTAQRSYGDSWKRRGGAGAFMMLARKWDRMELQVHKTGYDIFASCRDDQRSEGILDDIRDLRRYLMLVEAEVRARGVNPAHRDNDKTVEERRAALPTLPDYYAMKQFPGKDAPPPLIGPNTCTSDKPFYCVPGCKLPEHGH